MVIRTLLSPFKRSAECSSFQFAARAMATLARSAAAKLTSAIFNIKIPVVSQLLSLYAAWGTSGLPTTGPNVQTVKLRDRKQTLISIVAWLSNRRDQQLGYFNQYIGVGKTGIALRRLHHRRILKHLFKIVCCARAISTRWRSFSFNMD